MILTVGRHTRPVRSQIKRLRRRRASLHQPEIASICPGLVTNTSGESGNSMCDIRGEIESKNISLDTLSTTIFRKVAGQAKNQSSGGRAESVYGNMVIWYGMDCCECCKSCVDSSRSKSSTAHQSQHPSRQQ